MFMPPMVLEMEHKIWRVMFTLLETNTTMIAIDMANDCCFMPYESKSFDSTEVQSNDKDITWIRIDFNF